MSKIIYSFLLFLFKILRYRIFCYQVFEIVSQRLHLGHNTLTYQPIHLHVSPCQIDIDQDVQNLTYQLKRLKGANTTNLRSLQYNTADIEVSLQPWHNTQQSTHLQCAIVWQSQPQPKFNKQFYILFILMFLTSYSVTCILCENQQLKDSSA